MKLRFQCTICFFATKTMMQAIIFIVVININIYICMIRYFRYKVLSDENDELLGKEMEL